MHKVTREITIKAPKQKVWAVLADLGSVHKYSDNVANSCYVTPNSSGVGAARRCDLDNSTWIEERATAWHEDKGYTLEVADGEGMGPVDTLIVDFELTESGHGTKVVQSMSYNMKGGLIRPLLNTLASGQMRKAIDTNLDGLKTYIEQGA